MAWGNNRVRNEGGGIRGLALAWALAKNNLVPPSVSDKTQVSTATNPAAPTNNNRIKDGLVSEWWFDEGSGTIVKDKADLTTQTDLTLSAGGGLWRQDAAKNNRWYMELSAGGALYNFNPTEINDVFINPLTPLSGLTLEAWVKPLSPSGANPGPGRIISFSNASTGSQDLTFMLGHGSWAGAGYNNANYHSRVTVGDDTNNSGEITQLWTGDDTSTSTLQHLVMTCDLLDTGNAEVKLYLDGVLKSSKIVNQIDSLFDDWNSAHDLHIGYETGADRKFLGGVYLVAMYSKALNQVEVNNNFSEGVVSVTDAYSAGRHLTIEDVTASTVNAGETISVNIIADGSRSGPVQVVLGASSTSGTYGVDFSFLDTTKEIPRTEGSVLADLSCSPTLSGDTNIVAYIATATGPNIISSPGQNLSEKTFRGISDQVAPEVMFKSPNPVHTISGGVVADQEVVSVGVSRVFFEPITVTVSGAGDPGNDAAYAWVKEDGTYSDFPSEATYTVSADNWEKWAKIHSYSGTGGILFPDGDVLSATVVSGALSGGGALTVRAAASATNVTIDHPDFGMGAEPTSANTGYRLDTTALTLWTGDHNFSNSGVDPDHNTVPETGLVISGYKFTSKVVIYTSNPITFIDCYFANPSIRYDPAVGTPDYCIQSNTPNPNWGPFPDAGKQLELHHCTFYGGGIQSYTTFRRMFKCSFNWYITQNVRLRPLGGSDHSHDMLLEECWFGPHCNMPDSPLNGYNGMYDPDEWNANHDYGLPHCDVCQIRGGNRSYRARFLKCTIAWTADKWQNDSTVNPNHQLGANPDKIFQAKGSATQSTAIDNLEFDRCWIYGAGNSWMQCSNINNVFGFWTTFTLTFKSNLIGLDANGGGWNSNFESDPNSGNYMNYTRVTDGNNKFMRTGTKSFIIPQVAIDAGTKISHTDGPSSTVFDCDRWLLGLDSVTFYAAGLNTAGLTSFDRRSTPIP